MQKNIIRSCLHFLDQRHQLFYMLSQSPKFVVGDIGGQIKNKNPVFICFFHDFICRAFAGLENISRPQLGRVIN